MNGCAQPPLASVPSPKSSTARRPRASKLDASHNHSPELGGVPERSNGTALKVVEPFGARGFESHPRR